MSYQGTHPQGTRAFNISSTNRVVLISIGTRAVASHYFTHRTLRRPIPNSIMSSSDSEDDIPLGKLKKEQKQKAAASAGAVPKKVKKEDPEPVPAAAAAAASAKTNGNSNGGRKRPAVKYEENSDASDDDGDFEPAPKKKKSKAKASSATKTPTPTKKKASKKSSSSSSSSSSGKKKTAVKKESASSAKKKRELKKLEKADRLQHAMQAFLWWDAPEPPAGCQWNTMEHAGVSFPEPYKPHGIKMKYNGEDIELNPPEEEIATFFAATDPTGMHLGNPKTAPIYEKNWFADFRAVLDKDKKKIIKDFKKCNFDAIRAHLDQEKLVKKAITDAERKVNKATKEKVQFQFGYCLVDGHLEKVGNFNMEPPGAFRGRGAHPKMGKIKNRVDPEQVALNVSECAAVPACGVAGHAWGELRHDPQVQWLSKWHENINGQVKYMQLAAQSSFKGKSDRSKYSKAALLCDNIDKIRGSYKKKLKSKELEERQLGTAMWVIDRLALRVGGEKDTDEEADTVGCCSLRVEHVKFDPNNEGGDNQEIELEFLGKDSMLFKQTIDLGSAQYNDNNGMGAHVYKNFALFCKKKKSSEQIFDTLTPSALNAHLKEIMDGLTAKVFRTYNASKTLQDELRKTEQLKSWSSLSAAEKVVQYNDANREVAILCNHQKSVSKAQETQLEVASEKIDLLKAQKKTLKKILKLVKSGDTAKIPTKKDEKKLVEDAAKAVEKAKKMKEKAQTNEEKIAATKADEKAKQQKRDVTKFKTSQSHLWEKVPSEDQARKKIENWNKKIEKAEMDLKHKDDNKEVSLGTSKINYMDPRISVAWCKRNEVPIEKIFSKTLRDKFNWAMAVPPTWEFNGEIAKLG